ncbi:hypothetical protein GCM10023238_38160 [Streptomyces heliomycini]
MQSPMDEVTLDWARRIAEAELGEALPRRWAHSQGVTARAGGMGQLLGKDATLLAAAAVLHDVGYTPRLAITVSIRLTERASCGTSTVPAKG